MFLYGSIYHFVIYQKEKKEVLMSLMQCFSVYLANLQSKYVGGANVINNLYRGVWLSEA